MKPFDLVTTGLLVASLLGCSKSNTEAAKTSTEHNAHKHDSSSARYTCPMHPEVISDRPGRCPKCGMDLTKVDEAAETGKNP